MESETAQKSPGMNQQTQNQHILMPLYGSVNHQEL